MVARKLFIIFISLSMITVFVSANKHLQTTTDQNTGFFKLYLHDKVLQFNLEDPGIHVDKLLNGNLKHLSFYHVNTHYEVYFHPEKRQNKEQVSLVQEFQIFNKQILLHGATRSYNTEGNLISEAHWERGKLHGPQRTWNNQQQMIEEKQYMHGYPVKTWTLYYSNGNKARTIVFPDNSSQWEQTEKKISSKNTNLLLNLPTHQTISAVETWYNQNGQKQKELCHRLTHHE